MVTVDRDRLRIHFQQWSSDEYQVFLKAKKIPETTLDYHEGTDSYTLSAPARFASLLGVDAPLGERTPLPLPDHLWDYQRFVVETALAARRYACWADCGLGKTAVLLEWARQVRHATGGRVLILTPLSVIPQIVGEAHRFYGADCYPVTGLKTRDELAAWCKGGPPGVGISNYQKLVPGVLDEVRHLAGVVLDESSILKSGGGVIKWNLIKSCRGVEYKLSCTATPAPNDVMEFASQASFLEKLRSEGEILWTFFKRENKKKGGKKTQGDWKVKPHARDAFFRFLAGWSIYLRSPAAYGFADNQKDIPPPVVVEHPVRATREQLDWLDKFRTVGTGKLYDDGADLGVTERIKLSQAAKGFLYNGKSSKDYRRIPSHKPGVVANLIDRELAAGRPTLVWTVYDAESDLIRELVTRDDVAVLSGKMRESARLDVLQRFCDGRVRCLISKASLLGFGMNFQHCKSMIFSGWNDSYEQWYQAVRRCYRYGQTDSVRVHVPFVQELEGMVYQNILRKQRQFEQAASEQERHYRAAMPVTLRAA